jgi:hypothetical protein
VWVRSDIQGSYAESLRLDICVCLCCVGISCLICKYVVGLSERLLAKMPGSNMVLGVKGEEDAKA